MKIVNRKYILSIDGGGIRGIIPLCALIKLEQETGKPAREIFSFLAGTSTGAVISAALAVGIPAQQVLYLYLKRAPEIFPQRPWNILKRLILGWTYSTDKLNEIVREELGEKRDTTLNEIPVDILIPSKRVADGMPIYFVRDHKKNSCRCGRLRLSDCVIASSAVPTYFYPWIIKAALDSPTQAVTMEFVDGGVGVAGNPVYYTCVEAFYYHDEYQPDKTTVVSLGTGRFPKMQVPRTFPALITWILEELLSSPGEQQTELVRRHFPQTRFYRLDPDLSFFDPTLTGNIGLDDIGSIPRLVEYGKKFAELVDWEKILKGKDKTFLITDQKTMWYQYKQP